MEGGQKRPVTVKNESVDEAVGLQLEKCPKSLSVLSPDSAILVRNVENVKIETLSSEDSVLVEPSVLNETETMTPSSDLESSPVSGEFLSESTVLSSAVGLLQQPVVLPCVLTHVQGTADILGSDLPDQDPRGALLREDREDLAACVVFTSSEANHTNKTPEKFNSPPSADVVVTGHPTSINYLRQIFEHEQVNSQGQMVSTLPHGITSPLSPSLPELHQCKWENCCEHFLSLEDLVSHVSDFHIRTEASEYSCRWQGCPRNGKGFNARYKMLVHMRTHTGERPHRCNHESCGKSFSRLENLKIHTRSHTGEKPYACPVEGCSKRYSNSSDRYKHTRTHSETKPYHCKVVNCFKKYTDPSSLRKHYKTIHGKDLVADEQE